MGPVHIDSASQPIDTRGVTRGFWLRRLKNSALGIYRFWRDSGYVAGALVAGILADGFGMRTAIGAVGALTLASGALAGMRMPETISREVSG